MAFQIFVLMNVTTHQTLVIIHRVDSIVVLWIWRQTLSDNKYWLDGKECILALCRPTCKEKYVSTTHIFEKTIQIMTAAHCIDVEDIFDVKTYYN